MLWRFIPLFLGLIFYAIIAATSNIFLGLITITWSIIFLAVNIFFASKLQPLSYRSAESLSTLKGRVVDSISNISLVHENAFILGEREYIKKYIKKQYDAGLKSWWFSEWVLVVNGIIVFIFIFTIITFSIQLFQNKLITIGSVVMITTIASDLTYQLFFIAQEIRDSSKLYGQINEGLDEILKEHLITDPENAKELHVKEGVISIEKINFEYDKVKVFENFSNQNTSWAKNRFCRKKRSR